MSHSVSGNGEAPNLLLQASPKHKPFGKWADTDGYAGFVPSYTYFRGFYDAMIEKHAAEIDQHMAMLPARIICIDHSHKVIFQRFVQKH